MPIRKLVADAPALLVLEYSADGRRWPVFDFLDSRNGQDIDKMWALIEMQAKHGLGFNREKVKPVEGSKGLYEFKAHQARLLWCNAMVESQAAVICLSGFLKKQNKLDPAEIKRAQRLKVALEAELSGPSQSAVRKGRK